MQVTISAGRSLGLPTYTVTVPGAVPTTHYAAPLAFRAAVAAGMAEDAAFDAMVAAMEKAEPRVLANARLAVSL